MAAWTAFVTKTDSPAAANKHINPEKSLEKFYFVTSSKLKTTCFIDFFASIMSLKTIIKLPYFSPYTLHR